MPNYDGEWELRIFYTTTPSGMSSMNHTLTIDVNVTSSPIIGDAFSNIDTTARDTTVTSLSTLTDTLIDTLDGAYPASANFGRAELWFAEEGTTDFVWYSVYSIGQAGSNANPSVAAHQTTLTFRTSLGGIARFQMMEDSNTGDLKTAFPLPAGISTDIALILTGASNGFKGRDNGWLLAGINESQGQNEKLWRKRYRAT